MKKIKKRIFEYTPQPIQKFWPTLGILLLCTGLIFALLSLIVWQGWLFSSVQSSWITLAIISLVLCFALIRNKVHIFKFPFLLQRYLINPELAQDLKQLSLRSSDAVILDYKKVKTPWWQTNSYALLLERNIHEAPQWFYVNFDQVFNQHDFFKATMQANDQLLGQQVLIYYLARSHQIVQIYQLHPTEDLSCANAYVNAAQLGKVNFDKIPTRLVLDLPQVSCIDAIRSDDQQGHMLKLTTRCGQCYHISSQTVHFDKLELALSHLIDFVRYRKFKHDPNIQHMQLSKRHRFFYWHVMVGTVLAVLLVSALFFQDWSMLLFSLLLGYLYLNHLQHLNTSVWIKEGELK